MNEKYVYLIDRAFLGRISDEQFIRSSVIHFARAFDEILDKIDKLDEKIDNSAHKTKLLMKIWTRKKDINHVINEKRRQ